MRKMAMSGHLSSITMTSISICVQCVPICDGYVCMVQNLALCFFWTNRGCLSRGVACHTTRSSIALRLSYKILACQTGTYMVSIRSGVVAVSTISIYVGSNSVISMHRGGWISSSVATHYMICSNDHVKYSR